MRYWINNGTHEIRVKDAIRHFNAAGEPAWPTKIRLVKFPYRNSFPHLKADGWRQEAELVHSRCIGMGYNKARDFVTEMESCE